MGKLRSAIFLSTHLAKGRGRSSQTSLTMPFRCVPINLVCAQALRLVLLFVTPWTVARQAPLSMDFPGKNSGVGLPFPASGDLPHPRIIPTSPEFPAMAGRFFTTVPSLSLTFVIFTKIYWMNLALLEEPYYNKRASPSHHICYWTNLSLLPAIDEEDRKFIF